MRLILSLTLALIFTVPALSHAKEPKNKHFDAIKLYADRDFVLNDTLEFALFDLSELKFVNDSKPVKVQIRSRETLMDEAKTETKIINALTETKKTLSEFPKLFYRALNSNIHGYKVPVTLYASESPDYAKPLQLYIKIKHIHLKPTIKLSDGQVEQPITMRIYGQIKDKKSSETLVKYYDSADISFILGPENPKNAYTKASKELMANLSLYLKSKY